ncbi:MAG: transglycosylase SLT domain-containing protein, partial [Paracoccaceae bacterium]
WHGENFQSVAHMFDPTANATYAARFLRDLYAEKGSWEAAAGAYHSRTPAYAERYAARFVRFRQDMVAADEVADDIPDIPDIVLAASDYGLASAPDAPRVNNYPLLQGGTGGSFGSLVPLSNSGGLALFGPAPPPEMATE